MPTINLGLIALPNGPSKDGKQLRVSVVVAPRLGDGAALSDFDDFQHWTKRVAAPGVSLTLEAGAKKISAKPIPPVVGQGKAGFRPDLWDALFPVTVPVSPHRFDDYRGRLVVSYPALTTLTALKGTYQIFGLQFPDRLPQVTPPARRGTADGSVHGAITRLLSPFDVWSGAQKDGGAAFLERLRYDAFVRQTTRGGAFAPAPVGAPGADGVPTAVVSPSALEEAGKAYVLYHAMPVPDYKDAPAPTADEAAALYDFHAALTALHAYPLLMRALGLILDVEIAPGDVADSPGSGGYAQLSVDALDVGAWKIAPSFDRPPTAYVHDKSNGKTRFATAPSTPVAAGGAPTATGDVWNGLLQLNPATFHLTQLDVDGAMRQLMTFAEGVQQAQGRSRAPASLPATRSAGLGLTVSGRGGWLLDTFARNGALMDASPANETPGSGAFAPLTTLDVTRGYRVDVWSSQTGRWHSLHARLATYTVGADGQITLGPNAEEGFLQPSATASADPSAESDLYVHERMLRWNGWSLSVPRPARALNRSADPSKALDEDPTEGQPSTPFKLQTAFEVESGSLPRLRFGVRYRLRARAVDLAGNSRPLEEPDEPADSTLPPQPQGMPYLRFQPVPAPVVVPRRKSFGPGASAPRLVIRSFNADPSQDAVATTEVTDRHVAPPKTTLQLAEQHGALDGGAGLASKATYDLIAVRDKNGPPDAAPSDTLGVDWLTDPIARGAAWRELPGMPPVPPEEAPDDPAARFQLVPFDGDWPDPKAFRIELAEGDAAPAWDAGSRVLRVSLPKGRLVKTRLSSYVASADLALLGPWQWLVEAFESFYVLGLAGGDPGIAQRAEGTVANWQRVAAQAPLGGLWMLTPYREVTLVHAVQQPLGRPRFAVFTRGPVAGSSGFYPGAGLNPALTAWRKAHSHDAYLFGAIRFHGSSTAKLDLVAEWTEPVDDPEAQAQVPVMRAVADELVLGALDARRLTASGDRPTGFFVNLEAVADNPDLRHGLGEPDPDAPDAAVMSLDAGLPIAPRQQFGDTRHRVVSYRAVATSRFREYFEHDKDSLDFTRTSAPVQVDVPSSAPPLPPKVLAVLPTFAWRRDAAPQVVSSIRRGNGVRIHLERPWYSSGEGELLAVLCRSASGQGATSDWLSRHVTQWGQDPIWRTRSLADYPSQADFPARVDPAFDATRGAVKVAGGGPAVAVAAHAVRYDGKRDQMIVDIVVETPDTYMPFLRLALARYQPFSIPDVELSPLVLADIAQLAPDRTAVLVSDPSRPGTYALSVSGIRPEAPLGERFGLTNVVTVEVQRRVAGMSGDLGWEAAAHAATVTPVPSPATTDTLLWDGFVTFGEPPAEGDFRIAIREFELLEADKESGWPAVGDVHVGGRLIYAEFLGVPGTG